ncbi:hypothetical protein M5E06_17500 [Azospirillum sp. A1-3]|uniref:hypothetical protein n=1 Tax=Azospirillum sp. A1-3 TaxID=185874 RepID=UPI00207708FA|nr:hypothetical protein [Azospirillum sp. A1-3]MCM8735932.1 hypothetical protein [Azospirillum sp. A1-3]
MTERILRQIPMVHLYGQPSWRDDAHIIGNRAGLESLRDAIDKALKTGAEEAEVFATDGEGYGIQVVELNDAILDDMRPPYTDPEAKEMFDQSWPDVVREFLRDWSGKRRAGHGA